MVMSVKDVGKGKVTSLRPGRLEVHRRPSPPTLLWAQPLFVFECHRTLTVLSDALWLTPFTAAAEQWGGESSPLGAPSLSLWAQALPPPGIAWPVFTAAHTCVRAARPPCS